MYSFFLKNSTKQDYVQLENTPKGWENFSKKIKRNVDQRRVVVSYPTELVFWGDGFNLLYDTLNNDGYDTVFDFLAEKQDVIELDFRIKGQIFLIDVTFDLERRTASVEVKEDGYLARLWGNLKNPIRLPSKETKNGLPMTPTSLIPVFLNNSDVQPTFAGLRIGIDVYEALKEMVINMSDSNVSLTSPAFENIFTTSNENNLNRSLVLMRGKELRLGGNNRPFTEDANGNKIQEDTFTCKTSFEELFTAVARLYNLYLYPNVEVDNPEIIIDTEDTFYGVGDVEIESPETRILKFFQELFYSRVRTGSRSVLFESGNTRLNFPDFPLVSFKNDQFYINGKSNVDNELDLTINPYLIDSNIIRELLLSPENDQNELYDNDLFLIQVEKRTPIYGDPYAIASQYIYLGEQIYNGGLLTNEVLKRYNIWNAVVENFPSFIFDATLKYQFNPTIDKTPFALKGGLSVQNTIDDFRAIFSTAIFDNSNNAFNGTLYTAQIAGTYSFKWNLNIVVTRLETDVQTFDDVRYESYLDFYAYLYVRDNGVILSQKKITLANKVIKKIGSYTLNDIIADNVVLEINQTIELRLYFLGVSKFKLIDQQIPFLGEIEGFYNGIDFQCTRVPYQGVSYTPQGNKNAYKGQQIDITHAINQEQAKKIIDNPEKSISLRNFVEMGDVKECWIDELEINYETGKIDGTLIANINNEQEN